MIQKSNELKKIAIVDGSSDLFRVEEGRLKKETVKNQVQYFKKAAGLLNYLRGLKQDRLTDQFPDYILVDIQFKDMKAASFLDSIEQILGKMEAPEVFILSSSASKKKRDLAMQYPFVSAYLEKPVPVDLLELLIAGNDVDNSPH